MERPPAGACWTPLKVDDEYELAPPIVRAAVTQLLFFANYVTDEMGYDLEYFQEDLPLVVAEAIAPWKQM